MTGRAGRTAFPRAGVAAAVAAVCSLISAQAAVIRVPADAPTVQGAIDAAADGDQIRVAPGVYAENIRFRGKAIEVLAEMGPAATVIDGSQSGGSDLGSVVHFIDGEGAGSVCRGFTLRGGTGALTAVVRRGGGIYCENASPVIDNCWITGNTAGTGGGVAVAGGGPTIAHSRIYANSADAGAGIYAAQAAALTVADCAIEGNDARLSGGGIQAARAGGLVLSNCAVRRNTVLAAGGRGGGIWADSTTGLAIDGCAIEENSAGAGGGIAIESSGGVVIRSIVSRNRAALGGGCYLSGGPGPRIALSQITWNQAAQGGGVHCDGEASPLLAAVLIANNGAGPETGFGGGISCRNGASPQIVHCTVAANTSSGNGAGIALAGNANPLISHSIIANNVGGWGIYGQDPSCRPQLARNNFWNNSAGSTGGSVSPGSTDFTGDPLFASGAGGGYYLSHADAGQPRTSPGIDAGTVAAGSVCWLDITDDVCLDTVSARTDGAADDGPADLGWHAGPLPPSTPTPTITSTPPPATATPLPSATPAATDVPTITPRPTLPPEGPQLSLSEPVFSAGDAFALELLISNPGPAKVAQIYVALDVEGYYWFWPSWAPFPDYIDWRERTLPAAAVTAETVLRFTWPALDGAADGLHFHAAVIDFPSGELVGKLSTVTWGYR